MHFNTVETVSGNRVARSKCRRINDKYYEINKECFLMSDGKYHRIDNGKIEFDHETNKYVLISEVDLIEGYVGVDSEGKPKMGYFSPNEVKNVSVVNFSIPSSIKCISEDVAHKCGFEEDLGNGTFVYDFSMLSPKERKAIKTKRISGKYTFPIDYGAAPLISEFDIYHKQYYTTDRKLPSVVKELGKTTYGIELESYDGFIPERFLKKYGLIALRDGSLRHNDIKPYEYTTIPLKGELGINTLIDIVKVYSKYTTISDNCALHIHLGNFPRTKEYTVAIYRLMLLIQEELYSIFPKVYRDTSMYGFKQKNYCAPLKDLGFVNTKDFDINFDKIYNYYVDGADESFRGFGAVNHPYDRDSHRKWNIRLRYKNCNLINLIWGSAGTIEYRLHPPTQNVHKIVNWLFIVNAINKFAELNVKDLSNFSFKFEEGSVTLNGIMQAVYSKELASTLINYIDFRKQYMEINDVAGYVELAEDLDINIEHSVLKMEC